MWNRQRRDEVLIDVDDVALGHQSKLRWNDPQDWIWSATEAQEPLIAEEAFTRAQRQFAAGVHGAGQRKERPTPRPYVLRRLIRCGVCGRRMQGNWNHGQAHYRCRFPAEYALANRIEHPPTVYVRESAIMPALDRWLAQVFDPGCVDETIEALTQAQGPDDTASARIAALQRRIDDCDTRLSRYRAALDAGADPLVIAGWMADVQRERLQAQNDLGGEVPPEQLTPNQIWALVTGIRDAMAVLAQANPAAKAAIYADLGLELTYHPDRQLVIVEADVSSRVRKTVSERGLRLLPHVRRQPGCSPWSPELHLEGARYLSMAKS